MKIDYISPADPNLTPSQVRELQESLQKLALEFGYRGKLIVLPPGSKVTRLDDES